MNKDHSSPPSDALAAGGWLHNPATGELANLVSADTDGRRIEVDLWLQPGAAVAGAHVHEHFIERFLVREGEVGFQVGGSERTVRAGDALVEVPAGTVHDWWNGGDGIAHVRVEVVATTSSRPARRRFASMIEGSGPSAPSAASTPRASPTRFGSRRSPASTAT